MRRRDKPDARAVRNARILRLRDVERLPVTLIAQRFGMTCGQVSQICQRMRKVQQEQQTEDA